MEPVRLPPDKHELMRRGGVWVPSPLALSPEKRVMDPWQRLLTLYYIRSGARTVIPGAHTGEFAGGDLDLYAAWLKLVREMTEQHGGGEMFLMAAIGAGHARRQAELAAREGFDVVMVAPTAFTDLDDDGAMELLRDVAGVIPIFGFELQRVIPGSRAYSMDLWMRIFEVAYGAKGASFNTYRSQIMLEAAARSVRRGELVLATGNDDRIVYDLGGVFPFEVGGETVRLTYSAGLLGHFATDTHAAVEWSARVRAARDGAEWDLPLPKSEMAHRVNVCNGALFDAANDFKNSVYGVKLRLTQLGLLPEPVCFHEDGREGMADELARAYAAHPVLNDELFLAESLGEMKRMLGVH